MNDSDIISLATTLLNLFNYNEEKIAVVAYNASDAYTIYFTKNTPMAINILRYTTKIRRQPSPFWSWGLGAWLLSARFKEEEYHTYAFSFYESYNPNETYQDERPTEPIKVPEDNAYAKQLFEQLFQNARYGYKRQQQIKYCSDINTAQRIANQFLHDIQKAVEKRHE